MSTSSADGLLRVNQNSAFTKFKESRRSVSNTDESAIKLQSKKLCSQTLPPNWEGRDCRFIPISEPVFREVKEDFFIPLPNRESPSDASMSVSPLESEQEVEEASLLAMDTRSSTPTSQLEEHSQSVTPTPDSPRDVTVTKSTSRIKNEKMQKEQIFERLNRLKAWTTDCKEAFEHLNQFGDLFVTTKKGGLFNRNLTSAALADIIDERTGNTRLIHALIAKAKKEGLRTFDVFKVLRDLIAENLRKANYNVSEEKTLRKAAEILKHLINKSIKSKDVYITILLTNCTRWGKHPKETYEILSEIVEIKNIFNSTIELYHDESEVCKDMIDAFAKILDENHYSAPNHGNKTEAAELLHFLLKKKIIAEPKSIKWKKLQLINLSYRGITYTKWVKSLNKNSRKYFSVSSKEMQTSLLKKGGVSKKILQGRLENAILKFKKKVPNYLEDSPWDNANYNDNHPTNLLKIVKRSLDDMIGNKELPSYIIFESEDFNALRLIDPKSTAQIFFDNQDLANKSHHLINAPSELIATFLSQMNKHLTGYQSEISNFYTGILFINRVQNLCERIYDDKRNEDDIYLKLVKEEIAIRKELKELRNDFNSKIEAVITNKNAIIKNNNEKIFNLKDQLKKSVFNDRDAFFNIKKMIQHYENENKLLLEQIEKLKNQKINLNQEEDNYKEFHDQSLLQGLLSDKRDHSILLERERRMFLIGQMNKDSVGFEVQIKSIKHIMENDLIIFEKAYKLNQHESIRHEIARIHQELKFIDLLGRQIAFEIDKEKIKFTNANNNHTLTYTQFKAFEKKAFDLQAKHEEILSKFYTLLLK